MQQALQQRRHGFASGVAGRECKNIKCRNGVESSGKSRSNHMEKFPSVHPGDATKASALCTMYTQDSIMYTKHSKWPF